MIKTPLSTAIGGVGFYTKNAVVIGGGHKPEPPFDIASLFSNGEQGIWLDPNDLSTMFQDVGCTVPITVGQTAGYVYDSSKQLVRRRNLLTDTELSSLNAFPLKGGAISLEVINGKNLLKISNASRTQDSYAYMSAATELNKEYVFSITIETVNNAALDTATRTDFALIIGGSVVATSNYVVEKISIGKARISCKFIASKTTTTCGVVKYKDTTDKDLYLSDYQLEAEQATQYQAIDVNNSWVGKFGAYQVDSAKQSILGVDAGTGYKYLGFDGVDDFYITSAFALPQPFTVMLACETTKSSASQTLFSAGQGGYFLMVSGGTYLHTQQLSGNPMLLQPKNTKDVLSHIAENGNVRIRSNLGEKASNELVSQTPYTTLGEKYIGIFNPTTFSTAAGIKLYAMLVINRALTTEEEAAVRKEFNKRMGIV